MIHCLKLGISLAVVLKPLYMAAMKGMLFILFFVSQVWSHAVERSFTVTYLFPVNENASGISVQDLKSLLNILDNEYRGRIANKNLSWMKDVNWESPYIGAGSNQIKGEFYILLLGGLVRAKYMTIGALAAVLCHELGHKLAGPPHQQFPGEAVHWSSSEGQADTFAAAVCLPKVYDQLKTKAPRLLSYVVEDSTNQLCRLAVMPERCQWVASSGIDLIQSMQVYFETEIPFADPLKQATEKPTATLRTAYPSYQCRMDIYKAHAARPNAKRLRCWFVD